MTRIFYMLMLGVTVIHRIDVCIQTFKKSTSGQINSQMWNLELSHVISPFLRTFASVLRQLAAAIATVLRPNHFFEIRIALGSLSEIAES